MSYELYAAFAKRLVDLCVLAGLPERGRQAFIARLCGVKPSSVNKWFNAVSLPDAANLLKLAKWANTSVDWLLDGRRPANETLSTAALQLASGFDQLNVTQQGALVSVAQSYGIKIDMTPPTGGKRKDARTEGKEIGTARRAAENESSGSS